MAYHYCDKAELPQDKHLSKKQSKMEGRIKVKNSRSDFEQQLKRDRFKQ